MKKIALLIMLLSTKLFAMPVEHYTCADESQQWKVQAWIVNEAETKYIGSFAASLQGWTVLSENFDKSDDQLHTSVSYSTKSGIVFGGNALLGNYALTVPGREPVLLSCTREFKDLPGRTCQIKTCGPKGATWHTIEVPPGHKCIVSNVQCKV